MLTSASTRMMSEKAVISRDLEKMKLHTLFLKVRIVDNAALPTQRFHRLCPVAATQHIKTTRNYFKIVSEEKFHILHLIEVLRLTSLTCLSRTVIFSDTTTDCLLFTPATNTYEAYLKSFCTTGVVHKLHHHLGRKWVGEEYNTG